MKRRVVIVAEVEGGNPDVLAADLRAWAQEQQFRALLGRAGGRVGKIHAAVIDAPGKGSQTENSEGAKSDG